MYVNGEVDPWHALSVLETLDAGQPAVRAGAMRSWPS
jgi:hypothetical protein